MKKNKQLRANKTNKKQLVSHAWTPPPHSGGGGELKSTYNINAVHFNLMMMIGKANEKEK